MRKIHYVMIVLKFIFKGECAELFVRLRLLFGAELPGNILRIHNPDLTALCATIQFVSYIFTRPVPAGTLFHEFFGTVHIWLHSLLKRGVRLCHIHDV